jgi:hypothetical protein
MFRFVARCSPPGANDLTKQQRVRDRAVSKLEYDTAKREYVLISKGGRYVQTGHFWRRYYWWCHV